jgi:hypothetical protein
LLAPHPPKRLKSSGYRRLLRARDTDHIPTKTITATKISTIR